MSIRADPLNSLTPLFPSPLYFLLGNFGGVELAIRLAQPDETGERHPQLRF
jgi:hypothetical protein